MGEKQEGLTQSWVSEKQEGLTRGWVSERQEGLTRSREGREEDEGEYQP